MNVLSRLANYARSPGDPTILKAGPSVRPAADEAARVLGWFSIGLGALQLGAPHAIARFLGMQGREGLVRVYGLREIAAGMTSLSTDKEAGLWSRAGGDVMDILTLLTVATIIRKDTMSGWPSRRSSPSPWSISVGRKLTPPPTRGKGELSAITVIEAAFPKVSALQKARRREPLHNRVAPMNAIRGFGLLQDLCHQPQLKRFGRR